MNTNPPPEGADSDPIATAEQPACSAVPGYDAQSPVELTRSGWSQVIRRLWREIQNNQLSLVSAALAFYGFLAVFPALGVLVAIYGLAFDPRDIWLQSEKLAVVLPAEVHRLVFDQLSALAVADGSELGLGLIFSLALLLWSASTGVHHLIRAVNAAYDEEEERSFLQLRSLAVGFTLGAILFTAFAIALIAIVPQLLLLVGYAEAGQRLVAVLRWPSLSAGVVFALAVLYRYGPDRNEARWQWVSWGAVVAATIWLAGSGLFSWYAERFGSYNQTYGTLGAVVVLLLWLYISAFAILVGAELNAAMELQTERDSTTGPEEPLGERGAVVADTRPEDPETS